MRVLVYTILLMSSSSIFAQQGNENTNGTTTNTNLPITNNTNNKVVTPTAESEELESFEENEQEKDTTIHVPLSPTPVISTESIQRKKIQAIPSKGKYKKSPRNVRREQSVDANEKAVEEIDDLKYDSTMDESVEVVESAKAQEMTKISSNFNASYSTSDMQRSSRSPSYVQQTQMDQAVSYFEVNAPGSFESHYFKYIAGNYDTKLYPDLKAAEQIRPENSDVHVQMAGYFMIVDDVDSALIYVDKLREADRLSDNVVDYSGDILRSVPEEGALITHGFDDSYGSYYAQNSSGIRSDVTLISLDFLQSDTYKEELKEKGYELPKSTSVDVDYLAEFCALNVDKNLSISLTTPKEYFQAIQDKLYVVGLVFEYHPESYNNFERNDFLWNNSMEKEVVLNPTDEKSKQLSSNYLPMLLHLRKVYQVTGEEQKLKEVDEVSDQIGVQCRKYEQVQKVKASY